MSDSDLFEGSAQIMKETMELAKAKLVKQLARKWSVPIIPLKFEPLRLKRKANK